MSSHIKTPEEMHQLVTDIKAASTDSAKLTKIIEWLEAATEDVYAEAK